MKRKRTNRVKNLQAAFLSNIEIGNQDQLCVERLMMKSRQKKKTKRNRKSWQH